MDKVMDLHPAILGSAATDIYMSHWWQREGYPAKIDPICQ